MEETASITDDNVVDIDIVAAKKGDGEAFGRLIRNNKLFMYRIAKSILGNEHDVEDAIGSTLLKGYTNVISLRKNDNFKPWILRILINECYTILRKRKKEIAYLENQKSEITYEDKYDDYELMKAINSLEEKQKVVTLLFYYEDMSLKDIAMTLGIPEGTVKSRLKRAKEKLKFIINY